MSAFSGRAPSVRRLERRRVPAEPLSFGSERHVVAQEPTDTIVRKPDATQIVSSVLRGGRFASAARKIRCRSPFGKALI